MAKKQDRPAQQKPLRVPIDGIFAIIVILAFVRGFHGYPLLGGILALLAFIAYLVYLGTTENPSLLYHPTFKHWYWIVALWVLTIFISHWLKFRVIPAITTGAMLYHYACICLREDKVRYIPWGVGYSYRTARSEERSFVFWTSIVIFSLLGIGLLLAPFIFNMAAHEAVGLTSKVTHADFM
jgi:hypothetical protein